jgi:hypothetical protein
VGLGCSEVEMGVVFIVGGIDVKVAVGIGVPVGAAIVAGLQEMINAANEAKINTGIILHL